MPTYAGKMRTAIRLVAIVLAGGCSDGCVQATASTQLDAIPCNDAHVTICECEH